MFSKIKRLKVRKSKSLPKAGAQKMGSTTNTNAPTDAEPWDLYSEDQKVEFLLAQQSLALTETSADPFYAITLAILQHLSRRPWIHMALEGTSLLEYSTEWTFLTQELGVRNLEFLSELNKIRGLDGSDLKDLCSIFKNYFKKDLQVQVFQFSSPNQTLVLDTEYGSLTGEQTESIGLALSDILAKPVPKLERVLLYISTKTNAVRLISAQELFYPSKMEYAEELIDQLNRFRILSKAFGSNQSLLDLRQADFSSVSIFDQLNRVSAQLAKTNSFSELFQIILPAEPQHFILQNLIQLETELSLAQKAELRIQLIELISMAMFFPLRERVLEEKETYERTAVEQVERQARLRSENDKIEEAIKAYEMELQVLSHSIASAGSKLKTLQNVFHSKEKMSTAEAEEAAALRAKVQDLREKQALGLLMSQLTSIDPANLKVLLKIDHEKSWPSLDLPQLSEKLLHILKVQPSAELKARLKRNLPQDRQQILDAIADLQQRPKFEDLPGKVVTRGNHVILSNLLPELVPRLSSSVQEVQLICQGNLILDTDIEKRDFSGINFVAVARNIIATQAKVRIDLSGRDADGPRSPKAPNGQNEGDPGEPGDNGGAGGNGGSAHFQALEAILNPDSIEFSCGGGRGGNGQHGGDGHKGRKGTDGPDAPAFDYPYWINIAADFREIRRGTKGEAGGPGGRGGAGGRGGEGGKAGTAILKSKKSTERSPSFSGGGNGENGRPGINADSGSHGVQGTDYGWARAGFWATWADERGYNLTTRETYGYVWGVAGYELVLGSADNIQQASTLEQNQEIGKAQAQTKAAKLNKISASTVKSMLGSVIMETAAKSNANDKAEIRKTEASLRNLEHSAAASSKELKSTLGQLDAEMSKIQGLENQRLESSSNIRSQTQRRSQLDNSIAEAGMAERAAEVRARDLETLARDLEAAQEEVVQTATQAQLQSLQQNQLLQSVLLDAPADDGPSVQAPTASPTMRASGSLMEASSASEAYKLYIKLKARLTRVQARNAIESAMQVVIKELDKFPPDFELFMIIVCSQLEDPALYALTLKYVETHLAEDISCCYKFFPQVKSYLELPMETDNNNLIQHIFELRLYRASDNKTPSSPKSTDPRLHEYLRGLGLQAVLSKRLRNWSADKNPQIRGPVKRTLLEGGKKCLLELNSVFNQDTSPEDLNTFLKKLISSAEKELQKFELWAFTMSSASTDLNLKWALKALDKLKDPVGRDQVLKEVQFVLPRVRFSKIDEVQSAFAKVHEHKGSIPAADFEALQAQILEIYTGRFKNGQVRRLQKTFGADFQRVETMIESAYTRPDLETRIKAYEDLEKKMAKGDSSLEDLLVESYKEIIPPDSKFLLSYIGDPANENQLMDQLVSPTVRIVKGILFQLENGKLDHGKICDFSLAELSTLERILWRCLSDENRAEVEEIAKLIETKVKFDFEAPARKYDTVTYGKVGDELYRSMSSFVSTESDETSLTEGTKIRKYLKFSMARIQLYAGLAGKCQEIERLRESLYSIDKHDPMAIVKATDEFFQELLGSVKGKFPKEFSCTDFSSFLEATNSADFGTKPPMIYFYCLLQFVQYSPLETPDLSIGPFLEKLSKVASPKLSQDFKDTIDTMLGRASYPTRGIGGHLEGFGKEWRNYSGLFQRIQAHVKRLSSSGRARPIYSAATYASMIQQEVLHEINLNNYEELSIKTEDLFMEAPDLSQKKRGKFVKANQSTYDTFIESHRFMSTSTHPFLEELDLILAAVFRELPQKGSTVYFEVLQAWRGWDMYDHSDQENWSKFQEILKTNVSFSVDLKTGRFDLKLVDLVLGLDFQNPLRLLATRVLQKVNAEKANTDTLPEATASPEAFYAGLVPRFSMQKIIRLFLLPAEEACFRALLPNSAAAKDKVKEMIISCPPAEWAGRLELLNFKAVFERATSLLTSNIDQKETLSQTVFLAKKILGKPRGNFAKKWLTGAQKVKLYSAFKLSYFLQEPKDRMDWLQLMDTAFRKANGSERPNLFSTARDLTTFLTFARDLSLAEFDGIIKDSFPRNWLNRILLQCVVKDVQVIAEKRTGTEMKLVQSVELELGKYLEEAQAHKINFLLLLHILLRKEIRKLDHSTLIDPKRLLYIFQELGSPGLSRDHHLELNAQFQANPYLAYWPRLLRHQRLLGLGFPAETIGRLLGMDEKFGEEFVNRLADLLSRQNLPPDLVTEILTKFSSCEWILDDRALDILSPFELPKSKDEAYKALDKYCEERRSKELPPNEFIQTAQDMALNSENEDILDDIQEALKKVTNLLDSKYPVQFPIERAKFEQKMSEFFSSWKREKNTHWTGISFNDPTVLRTVALIYRAIQYDWSKPPASETEPSNEKPSKEPASKGIRSIGKHLKDKLLEHMPSKGDILIGLEDGANMRKLKSPRTSQLVALLFLVSGRGSGGKFGEIETGEGKSCIVAMFGAFCALLKARVHVITSNEVLAREDENKYRDFYALLGLTVGNNCDKEAVGDEVRRRRYNNNVVYGELGGFQGDLLNTAFHGKGIMAHPADVVIVDEVDSLLLDKGANMLYLSHDIAELKYLRTVFLTIWNGVQGREVRKSPTTPWREYSEADINIVRKSVAVKLKNDSEILYPTCLEGFIQARLGTWVKQAFRARFMGRNEDFILDEGRQKVVNMDRDTGVEQGNMHLSLGLQQFLQLKYRTKLSAETLKCVFMSNLKYFEDHAGKVYGITGTLGGEEELSLLTAKYKVKFFGLPRFKLNKRVEMEALVSSDEDGWLAQIKESLSKHFKTQPTLIICENIAQLLKVKASIESSPPDFPGLEIKEYKSSEKDEAFTEEIRNQGGLKERVLVLSTNLGGRGTDLKVADSAQASGLHVILSYLPSNLRVEKQAFGRTARAGECGTVQFVIKVPAGPDGSVPTITRIKEERKLQEIQRLDMIRTRDIPKIEIEDSLFTKYSEFVNKQVKSSTALYRYPKRIRKLQLEFLNNRWAVWLDSLREQLDSLHLQAEVGRQSIFSKFESFKEAQLAKLEDRDGRGFAEYGSELTKLGRCYERIAMKSFLGALSRAEFDEAGNICAESLETIKSCFQSIGAGLKAAGAFIAGESLLETCQKIHGIMDQLNRPSDIELGISTLREAIQREPHVSDSGSMYSGTLLLSKDPTDRSSAKKCLLEARLKILRRMEQNVSNIGLLQQTSEIRAGRNDPVPAQNMFQQQVNGENNLLQHHLNAIDSALPSDFGPTYFRTFTRAVETDRESKEIYELVLRPELGILKGYRISKKVGLSDDTTQLLPLEEALAQLSDSVRFVDFESLVKFLKKSLGKKFRSMEKFSAEVRIFTKFGFLKLLAENGFAEQDKDSYLIVLDSDKYELFKKEEDVFPAELQSYQASIISALFRQRGKLYHFDKLFPAPEASQTTPSVAQISEEVKGTLKQVLIQLKWLDNSFPLKVSDTGSDCIDVDSNPFSVNPDKLPESLKPYESLIQDLVLDKDGNPQETYDLSKIPFPGTEAEGLEELLKVLVSKGIVKEPRVQFSQYIDRDAILKRIEEIKAQFNSTDFQTSLQRVYSEYHSSTGTKEDREKAYKAYSDEILDSILNSIGSLKQNAKVRVNYHSLAVKVPLGTNQHCEELQEFLREGILDEIFTFDEFLRFYENPAMGVLVLGIAEIALGVTIEVLAAGLLGPVGALAVGPLVNVLISEGGSDLYYSVSQLYRGERIDWSDYKQYKTESLIFSGATCWTLGAGTVCKASRPLLTAIGKKVLIELTKASVKAAVFNFIEDNIGQAINNNLLGLKALLDQVIKSSGYEEQVRNFKANSEALRLSSYEKNQAQNFLNGLLQSISRVGGTTSYELRLTEAAAKVQKRLLIGMTRNLVKNSLPIQNFPSIGAFGSNGKTIMKCSEDIQDFVITTLRKMNEEIVRKSERLDKERAEVLHGDERPGPAEFEQITESVLTGIEAQFRTRIAQYIYEQLSGNRMKQRMYDTITAGYSTVLNGSRLSITDFVDDPDAAVMTDDRDAEATDSQSEAEVIVTNAGGRTKAQVEEVLGKTGIEYLRDIHSGLYVVLKSDTDLGLRISNLSSGLDDYLLTKS